MKLNTDDMTIVRTTTISTKTDTLNKEVVDTLDIIEFYKQDYVALHCSNEQDGEVTIFINKHLFKHTVANLI